MSSNEEQRIAHLEEKFDSAHELEQVLRVRFSDGGTYDLIGFFFGQDNDEEWPHCYTTIVRVVHADKGKRDLFKPKSAIMFHLNDVEKIEQITPEDKSAQAFT